MTAQTPELADFYADLEAYDVQPLWTQEQEIMTFTPEPKAVPWRWRWKRLRELAGRAGDLIPIDRGGDRRVLGLANPGLGGLPYATPTMWGAVQYLGPHESAPAHRHTQSSVRFVLEGDGVWTTVEGDPLPMEPGDLVLTPNWTWHEHHNPGDGPMAWFDGLDLPLVKYLDALFFELHPTGVQVPGQRMPERASSQRRYAAPGLVPAGPAPAQSFSPLMVYRWRQTDAALAAFLEDVDGGVASLRFTNPATGDDAVPTMRCVIHRFAAGASTVPVKDTGSAIYVVFRGAGTSEIGGERFDWSTGDMLVAPSWSRVVHHATEPSDVFCVSDVPVLEKLDLYRRDPDPGAGVP